MWKQNPDLHADFFFPSLSLHQEMAFNISAMVFLFFLFLVNSSSELVTSYAHHLEMKHDMLLSLVFEQGSYKKLYSYRHLINGFAVHMSPEQVKPRAILLSFYVFCLASLSLNSHFLMNPTILLGRNP